ncbi:hypothetical protein B0T16DRAFT_450856 [Cercophora newfieldiana]|uniref:Uncharacterized protein n=1 Tax=Cercophora newfieldiana TaxID=92897 RepID=A0AA40CYF0_9PEZI|nr:hypothetical protein B0T16DRAFT_450856 [Cercophora newfieldiana]
MAFCRLTKPAREFVIDMKHDGLPDHPRIAACSLRAKPCLFNTLEKEHVSEELDHSLRDSATLEFLH